MLYVKVLVKGFFKTERWSNSFFSRKIFERFFDASVPPLWTHFLFMYSEAFCKMFRFLSHHRRQNCRRWCFCGGLWKFHLNTSCIFANNLFTIDGFKRSIASVFSPRAACSVLKKITVSKRQGSTFFGCCTVAKWMRRLAYCLGTSFGGCCLRINYVCLSRVLGFARVAFWSVHENFQKNFEQLLHMSVLFL